jgi:sugar-specific transcriptional regulator TrmB
MTLDTKTLLKRLGATDIEALIWCKMEGRGAQNIVDIAKVSGYHRPTVYRALKSLDMLTLIEKEIRGARIVYRAVPQAQVVALWRKADTTLDTTRDSSSHGMHQGNVFTAKGNAAITEAFDHVTTTLKRGDTFYRITSEKNLDAVNALLSPNYRKTRDAKRLERLVISNRISGNKKKSRLERFIRYLDTEDIPFMQDVIMLIYGSYVTYIDLTRKEVTRLENERIASFERARFKALYTKLERF